jgi:hypothetical protein
MEIKKAIVDGVAMEVVTQEEYARRKTFGDAELLKNTCIQHENTLFPVMNVPISGRIAPYAVSHTGYTKYYNKENNEKYKADANVIDFSNVKSTKEMIEKQNALRNAEITLLTAANSDTFSPVYDENDSPALTLVKQCLEAKNVPLENYKGRFESNCDFNNTIRLVTSEKNHSISIQKIKTIGEKFDIKFKLIAEDQSDDVPNMMETKFEKEI